MLGLSSLFLKKCWNFLSKIGDKVTFEFSYNRFISLKIRAIFSFFISIVLITFAARKTGDLAID